MDLTDIAAIFDAVVTFLNLLFEFLSKLLGKEIGG